MNWLIQAIKYLLKPPKTENPLVKNTWGQYFREKSCHINGCIKVSKGYYKGLPQSFCKRCGRKTHYASKELDLPEWRRPYD